MERIEKQNFKVVSRIHKGQKEIICQPGDLEIICQPVDSVWIHFCKELFSSQRKTNLSPRGDDSYQVLERNNNNAYKIDLPREFSVNSTFNVAYLRPSDLGVIFLLRGRILLKRGR